MDWPGRVASVVFLPGCNYRCGWCHNRELVEHPEKIENIPIDVVLTRMGELREWLDGVVITGGEPTINANLLDIVHCFAEAGIPMKLDTNGSRPDVIENLIKADLLDGISMDIKAPLKVEHYEQATGVRADVEAVKRSIRLILSSGIWYEFRTTVVPGLHTVADVAAIRAYLDRETALAGLKRPLKLQAFKPSENMPEPYRSMRAMDLDEWKVSGE